MWKGRTPGHNLASGLDDYPRGPTVSDEERHLDLQMWEFLFARTMKELARVLGYQEDISYFDREMDKLRESTEQHFFDGQMYRDYSGTQFIMENGEFPYLWRGDNKCGKENLNPLGTPAECNPYSELPCCSEFG